MRSGNLIAVNDHYICQLLEDPDYQIKSDGTVLTRIARTGKRFADPNRWRKTGYSKKTGHVVVKYKRKQLQLARIIYAKFKGQLEVDLVIYHKDHDVANNHKDNLIKGTQSQNNKHSIQNPHRVHNPIRHCKLNFETAEQIRRWRHKGFTYKMICHHFKLAKSTVSDIINQKIWKRCVHTPNKKYNY